MLLLLVEVMLLEASSFVNGANHVANHVCQLRNHRLHATSGFVEHCVH